MSDSESNNTEVTSARDLDVLYRETDKLYHEMARGCGLSDCAYWILYEVQVMGGRASQRAIAERFSYSKQTVNSALKTLEAKGLVELCFAEGSRRAKTVCLTPEGHAFSERHIIPAIDAEDRAFTSLSAEERAELLRLVAAYTRAIDRELSRLHQKEEDQ